jgi:hypothetical protein
MEALIYMDLLLRAADHVPSQGYGLDQHIYSQILPQAHFLDGGVRDSGKQDVPADVDMDELIVAVVAHDLPDDAGQDVAHAEPFGWMKREDQISGQQLHADTCAGRRSAFDTQYVSADAQVDQAAGGVALEYFALDDRSHQVRADDVAQLRIEADGFDGGSRR